MPFAAFLVRKRLPPRVSLCTFWGWQTWCSTNLAMISRPDSGGNEKGGSNFLPTGEASASSKPSQTPTLSHWVNATQRSTPLQHTLAYQPSFLQTGTPGIHETHLSSPQHCSPPPPPPQSLSLCPALHTARLQWLPTEVRLTCKLLTLAMDPRCPGSLLPLFYNYTEFYPY